MDMEDIVELATLVLQETQVVILLMLVVKHMMDVLANPVTVIPVTATMHSWLVFEPFQRILHSVFRVATMVLKQGLTSFLMSVLSLSMLLHFVVVVTQRKIIHLPVKEVMVLHPELPPYHLLHCCWY